MGMILETMGLRIGIMRGQHPSQLQKTWRAAWTFGIHARHRFQNSLPVLDGANPCVHTTRSALVPSVLTSPNNLHASILVGQTSSDHLVLPHPQVHHGPHTSSTYLAMCWTASRGRGRTWAGRSRIGNFRRKHAGHPTASYSFRSPSQKGIPSISREGSQVVEPLPSQHF